MKALYILHKQNRLLNILLTAAAIVFFAIVYFVILHTTYMSSPAEAGKTLDGQNRYNITVLEKTPSIENLYNFNKALQENDKLTVYTATPVNIMIDDFSGDTGFAAVDAKGEGTYSPVYGHQINKVAEKMNAIELDTGRFFKNDEFIGYDGKKDLPVILGSSYFTLYDLGDRLKMTVQGQKVNAKVIGFLANDQELVTVALSQLSAAHQVIIPAQSYEKMPSESNEFARNSLKASANSMIVTSASKIDIRDTMLEVSKQSDFWNFSIDNAGGLSVNVYNTIIKANPTIVIGLFLVGLFAICLLIIKLQPKRNQRNQPLFRILLNSGMTNKQIKKYLWIEAMLIVGVGIVLPIVPFFIISQFAIVGLVIYLVCSLIISLLFMMIIRRRTVVEVERFDV